MSHTTEDLKHDLYLSLEDIFFGCNKSISITRRQVCKLCDQVVCAHCSGEGVNVRVTSHDYILCALCHGAGIVAKCPCHQCQGVGTFDDTKIFAIDIHRGHKQGDVIVLKGESNQHPRLQTGDVQVCLKLKPHHIYDVYRGVDLILSSHTFHDMKDKNHTTIDGAEVSIPNQTTFDKYVNLGEYGLWNADGISRGKLLLK